MAARHQAPSFPQTPELSISDLEDAYPPSDEEMPDREETDHLLRQAHHYVITEGGKDTPLTYMQRIHRINRDVIQEISKHNYECDPKLYRRVKQRIDHVLREFEDSIDADYSIYDYEVPEYYNVAVREPLRRTDSSPVTPDGSSTLHTVEHSGENDDSEEIHLYERPNNHLEIAYKKASASLPSPETVHMAGRKNMRIYSDSAARRNTEKTDPVTSNTASFQDPRVLQCDHLAKPSPKLPAVGSVGLAKVANSATVDQVRKDVYELGHTKNVSGDLESAPRAFLERLEAGQQASSATLVEQIRGAVNATPTKRRSSSVRSSNISSAPTEFPSFHDPSTFSEPSREDRDIRPAFLLIKAATEASIRSSKLAQSPSMAIETVNPQVASTPATRSRVRSRKDTLIEDAIVTAATTTAKRKRLSVDIVGEVIEGDTDIKAIPTKRVRTTGLARPYTPTTVSQSSGLYTPSSIPATTPALTTSGSSVASTPPVTKARAAGRKQRKAHTKSDFEERVTPERYAEIMAQREHNSSQGHESAVRGITRSGRMRKT